MACPEQLRAGCTLPCQEGRIRPVYITEEKTNDVQQNSTGKSEEYSLERVYSGSDAGGDLNCCGLEGQLQSARGTVPEPGQPIGRRPDGRPFTILAIRELAGSGKGKLPHPASAR